MFEPQDNIFNYLKKYENNKNIIIFNKALSEKKSI